MNTSQMKTWLIAADLSNVDIICSEIAIWLTEQNLSDHLFPIELLTREALNNAIIHGSQLNPPGKVHIKLQRDENTLYLKIRDEGPGFDWQTSLQNEMVDDDKENGRGLKLYQLYADQVKFNDLGNEVILVRHL